MLSYILQTYRYIENTECYFSDILVRILLDRADKTKASIDILLLAQKSIITASRFVRYYIKIAKHILIFNLNEFLLQYESSI